ncbi:MULTISPECIES: TetR/AcrR family transcriptional regulator [unclassified Rhodococcus (in: high G+C Gram-positive bacteria)]|uniref:TetR/AcrR family transcriptional regulator n=1 Tax=unclassified Rhodococcus (in: high G+C Gram-positive bacteria) TaxID=192944 RepID=UPI0003748680|nr:TetR/AcrR family transcriptional regulator [Rhodococcus sp. DK17]
MIDTVYMSGEVQSLRVRLIDSGRELLDQGGIDAVGLRAVARHAGVSHGAPRRYFPTHKALLAAIAASGFAELSDELRSATASESDPLARVRRTARQYLSFADTHRTLFELMFRHDLLEGSGEDLRQHSKPLFETVVAFVADTGSADPHVVALNLWTQLHGVATLRATRSIEVIVGDFDVDSFVAQLIDLHLRARA